MNEKIIAAAIQYAEYGWKVFPAHTTEVERKGTIHKAKIPATFNGHLDASSDPVDVELMFTGSHTCIKPQVRDRDPDILGMVHSAFLVVDVDVKHGSPGPESFEKLRPYLPKPLAKVRTSSGGWHWYLPNFKDPKLNERHTKWMPGLDILAGPKGWIAVPPSEGYEFIYGSMREVYEQLANRPARTRLRGASVI